MSKISAFVVIDASYLRFSYHFLPRPSSANVLFATMTHIHAHTYDVCDPFVIINPRCYSIFASSPDRTRTHAHTCDVCDPFVIITPRCYSIFASSPDRTRTHIRRMRSVCNHHRVLTPAKRASKTRTSSFVNCNPFQNLRLGGIKILQHLRIITRSHAHTCTHTYMRRMRSVCNHHSKILQHHRNHQYFVSD